MTAADIINNKKTKHTKDNNTQRTKWKKLTTN